MQFLGIYTPYLAIAALSTLSQRQIRYRSGLQLTEALQGPVLCCSFLLRSGQVSLRLTPHPGGGVLHYWVRRECAPVLGSIWSEKSGIGVYSHLEFCVIGVAVILTIWQPSNPEISDLPPRMFLCCVRPLSIDQT